MKAAALVYTAAGRLRVSWRLVVFALATFAGIVVAQSIAYPVASWIGGAFGARPSGAPWLIALGFLLGHWLTLRLVEPRGWEAVALDRTAARPAALLGGFALGAAAIGVPTAVLVALGWLRIEPAASGSSWEAAWRLTLLLAPAALWEELAFRGYLFAALREAAGSTVALTATSVLFGLIHLANPGADARSTTLVVLAGFFLGAVLLATRSLYATWMAHLAWNWTMAVLFHTPVSGLPFATPDYRTVDAGPDWVTGGVWGPEGGAGAALGMGAVMLYLMARRGGARRPFDLFSRRARRGEP